MIILMGSAFGFIFLWLMVIALRQRELKEMYGVREWLTHIENKISKIDDKLPYGDKCAPLSRIENLERKIYDLIKEEKNNG